MTDLDRIAAARKALASPKDAKWEGDGLIRCPCCNDEQSIEDHTTFSPRDRAIHGIAPEALPAYERLIARLWEYAGHKKGCACLEIVWQSRVRDFNRKCDCGFSALAAEREDANG